MVKRAMVFVFLTSLVTALPAMAEQGDREAARRHYAEGQMLFRDGQYEAALREFQAAYRADPHPVSLRSQAACLVQMGREREAVELYQRYLEAMPNASDRAQVESYIQEARSQGGRVYIVTNPQGATATLDGRPLPGQTPLNVEVSAGSHTLQLQAQGYRPETRTFQLSYGESQTIQVNLSPAAGQQPATTPSTPTPGGYPPQQTQDQGLRFSVPVWVMIGVTGAALITGIVTGSLALVDNGEYDDMRQNVGQYQESEFDDLGDSGETKALIADISFGIAAAAAITGIILFIVDNTRNRSSNAQSGYSFNTRRLNITPTVTDNGGGISAFGSF